MSVGKRPPTALILDLDGTLTDEKGIWRRALEVTSAVFSSNPAVLTARYEQVSDAMWDDYAAQLAFLATTRDRRLAVWRRALTLAEGVPPETARLEALVDHFAAAQSNQLRPDPILQNALARAGQVFRLVICTDGPLADQEDKLARLGLETHVHSVVSGPEVGLRKPNTALFARAARAAAADLTECVSIGNDPDLDIAPARALGMRTSLVGDLSDPFGTPVFATAVAAVEHWIRVVRSPSVAVSRQRPVPAQNYDPLGVREIEGSAVRQVLTPLLRRYDDAIATGIVVPTSRGTFLNRGSLYYDVVSADRHVGGVAAATSNLLAQPHVPEQLRELLLEHLHNGVCAAFYARWEWATDDGAHDDEALAVLDGWARDLAQALDCSADDDLAAHVANEIARAWRPTRIWPPHMRRRFRELDNRQRIRNETTYVVDVLVPEHGIGTIVCPLYGATGLAAALAARLRTSTVAVHPVRIGFHDLGYVDFSAPGDSHVDISRIAPPDRIEALRDAVSAGGTTLVVDDNVGYGSTLDACRRLVSQLGGTALTRAVETSWHLLDRIPDFSFAGVVDLPGIRPTFHHSLQEEMITLLRTGNGDAYVDHPARRAAATTEDSIAMMATRALSLPHWSTAQRRHLAREAALAAEAWRETAVSDRGMAS